MRKNLVLLLLAVVSCAHAQFVVHSLKCENMVNPLGIDTTTPHFSWKLSSGMNGDFQKAYEIEVASDSASLCAGEADLWRSGKVKSDASVMVEYAGKQLESRSLGWWRVRSWNKKGKVSKWSNVARFSVGVLDGNLAPSYIGLETDDDEAHRMAAKFSSSLLRKKLNIGSEVYKTFAHVNSLGYHELYVNGRKVGDNVLAPAVSQLTESSQIVSYDITSYMKPGENDVVIWLGQGWYKSTTFKAAYDGPLVKAEISCFDNGWKVLAQTGSSWKGSPSGYSDTGNWYPLQFGGERVDGRLVPTDMSTEALDKRQWSEIKTVDLPNMKAVPQMCEGNKIIARHKVKSISRMEDGSWVLDMGTVATGWLYFRMPKLKYGQEVKFEYTDYIPLGGKFESQGEGDIYIASGEGNEEFCNKFNHHAFRYVRVIGLPEINAQSAELLQISGDYASASTFRCSDSDINAVHDMINRTMRSLTFSGYMVDCPHLERTGYGGDGNSSTNALQLMDDVAPTYYNWMRAWGDVQYADGGLPHVAPAGGGGGGPYWCAFIVMAPWRTYVNYGDDRLIRKYYDNMARWFDYVEKYSKDGLLQKWPDTDNRMWYLGDWLAPNGVDVGGKSVDLVNNCAISESLGYMAKMAAMLGKKDDAAYYLRKKVTIDSASLWAFYNFKDSTFATGSQLDMSYPINVMDLPQEIVWAATAKNNELCRTRGNSHIGAGLVGVPVFTQWCIENRAVDLMYDILKQRDYPGYLYMIDNGATTTWEYWNGERSRVHNCYNGIGTWFYQAVGGLRPDENHPGYRHFFVAPQISEGIDWVEITKESPYGRIAVSWKKIAGGKVELSVTVPVGATATVELGGLKKEVSSGKYSFMTDLQ